MPDSILPAPRMLPPRGLLTALAWQIPLLLSAWPPAPTSWGVAAGVVLLAAGAALNVWAERLFRRHGVGVCPFTRVPVLVERGPYRLTRNPMYLGLVCLNLGVTLCAGILANLWSSIAFVIWLHDAFVLPEEQYLRAEVGAAFDQYARRVPRWLPFTAFS
jgi:protein-S-isoprenylcysteine O-methyltransferase Ste14